MRFRRRSGELPHLSQRFPGPGRGDPGELRPLLLPGLHPGVGQGGRLPGLLSVRTRSVPASCGSALSAGGEGPWGSLTPGSGSRLRHWECALQRRQERERSRQDRDRRASGAQVHGAVWWVGSRVPSPGGLPESPEVCVSEVVSSPLSVCTCPAPFPPLPRVAAPASWGPRARLGRPWR